MSRYTVPCDTFGPEGGEAVVGWDARRRTYFAQTFNYAATDERPTYAIGLTPGEIPTVVELIRESYAFARIDDDTVAALLDDPGLEDAGSEVRVGIQPLGPDQEFPATTPPARPSSGPVGPPAPSRGGRELSETRAWFDGFRRGCREGVASSVSGSRRRRLRSVSPHQPGTHRDAGGSAE